MMEAAAEERLQWAICCAAGHAPAQISPEGLGGLSRRSTTGAKTEALAKTEAFGVDGWVWSLPFFMGRQ